MLPNKLEKSTSISNLLMENTTWRTWPDGLNSKREWTAQSKRSLNYTRRSYRMLIKSQTFNNGLSTNSANCWLLITESNKPWPDISTSSKLNPSIKLTSLNCSNLSPNSSLKNPTSSKPYPKFTSMQSMLLRRILLNWRTSSTWALATWEPSHIILMKLESLNKKSKVLKANKAKWATVKVCWRREASSNLLVKTISLPSMAVLKKFTSTSKLTENKSYC